MKEELGGGALIWPCKEMLELPARKIRRAYVGDVHVLIVVLHVGAVMSVVLMVVVAELKVEYTRHFNES